jgi:hypothetical protein
VEDDMSERLHPGVRIGHVHLPRRAARDTLGKPAGVELLLAAQHRHVLLDATRPRLGPLGVLDLVEDRVPVRAVERGKNTLAYLFFSSARRKTSGTVAVLWD